MLLEPDHFFDQGDKLTGSTSSDQPTQVDLRRAISAAYYGVFHFTMACLADEVVGSSLQSTHLYRLVYRKVEHKALRTLCLHIMSKTLADNYKRYVGPEGFGADIQSFAAATYGLYEQRQTADYDPSKIFSASGARASVDTGRRAVGWLRRADRDERKTFLTLLLCSPR